MVYREAITVQRECEALLVPTAVPIMLPAGTLVEIMQSAGGTYTVLVNGNLARIEAKDADALGKKNEEIVHTSIPQEGPFVELDASLVWDQLKTCYDPEIPVNIVDLGLIYECTCIYQGEETGTKVSVIMTLTAPGCGMGPVLQQDVQSKVSAIPGVTQVQVDLVFDPPWSQDRMTDAAKLELGLL